MTFTSNKMKFTLLTPLFTFLVLSLYAQDINFSNSEILFEHPRPSDSGLGYPFIPFDYNSDNFADFIGGTFNGQFLYKGIGETEFEQLDIFQGLSDLPLKVTDFDNDGDMDVIMQNYINIYETADSFSFLLPNINFQETIVEVADFNNDGLTDLLTQKNVIFENDELIIHYNQGDNQFNAEVIYNEYDYADLDIGDIDNDGDIDIAVILEFEDVPIVILYNQDSEFIEQEIPHQFNIGRPNLKLLDLDMDDDLDIVTAGTFDDIYILENSDGYTQDMSTIKVFHSDIVYFNMADLNNDGNLEIVTITDSFSGFKMNVIKGNGGFDFDNPIEIEAFTGSDFFGFPNFNYVANNLTFHDIDNDNLLDIVYTDGFGSPNQIYWLKNNSTITSTNAPESSLKHISIFPNPVNTQITISSDFSLDKSHFEIISSCGKVVHRIQANGDQIDVSQLASGVYFLQSRDLNLFERFVKL